MRALAWRYAGGLIRAHPASFFVSLAAYVAFFALVLAPGLISKAVFDTLSGAARAGFNLWTLIGLLAAAQLSRFGFLYLGGVVWNLFRYRGEALFKRNMMDWAMTAPGPRILPSSTGEAVSRFRDDTLQAVGLATMIIVSPQALTGAAAFAVMVAIDAPIALLVVVPMLATVVATYMLTRGIQRYRKALREATAEVTGFIGETFGAVQAVKLAGAEGRMAERFKRLGEARRGAAIRDLMLTTSLTAFSANVAVVAAGFVLLLAAQAMRVGRFTVGDFTLFVNYLALVSAAPSIVGQLLATERQAKVSIDRMNAFAHGAPPLVLALAARPRPEARLAAPSLRADALEVFEARGLTCLHARSGRGVQGADLRIERGRFLAITGPVGSGKTTLVRALLGLSGRDAGDILWNGAPVADPSLFLTPPRCAYTPQTPRLFSETLRENLLMGEPDDPARLAAAIELAVFDEDVAALDAGLETPVGARGVTLSGGQAQRAAAARMFVRAPDLLVFDDLSSALDVTTERKLWRRLFASGERTCIAVSHRREALGRADEVLVLDEGRIVARGRARELLAASPLFRRIWGEGG